MSHYSKLSIKAAQVSRKRLQTLATSEEGHPSLGKMSASDEHEKKRSPVIPSEEHSTTKFMKDSRTQEHEQQRLKKAAEFVKARERKLRQGNGWVDHKQAHRQPEPRKSSGSAVTSDSKGRRDWIEETGDDEFEGMVFSDNDSNGMDSSGMLVPEPQRHEVKLADLIKVGKPHKPKGIADFEVIPHVRSVIALDDVGPDRADLEVEEPWEHIYSSDNEDTPEFSYAQVAARSK